MPTNESLEAFPTFDPDTPVDAPGQSVAVGEAVAAIGSPDALGGAGAVAIYAYYEKTNKWGFIGVLTGSRTPGSECVRGVGSSCVALGENLVVGAKGDEQTPGRVLVLKPSYGAWSYGSIATMATLGRKDAVKGDSFGASISHCRFGGADFIAVGAPTAAPPVGKTSPGQVFIFRGLRSTGEQWSASTISNPNPTPGDGDRFGAAVSIGTIPGGDGDTLALAVAAPGANEQGAVFVAPIKDSDEWAGKLEFLPAVEPSFAEASDEFKTSEFGSSLALSKGTLFVGAPADPNFETQIEGTGAVWTFDYSGGAFKAGARAYGPSADARFGASLAVSRGEDGAYLVVGAPGSGTGGEAFRYKVVRGEDGSTTLEADGHYAALPGKAGDRMGAAVSVSGSPIGTWALSGAPANPKGGQGGGGYLFTDAAEKPGWFDVPDIIPTPVRWGGQPLDSMKKYSPQISHYLS